MKIYTSYFGNYRNFGELIPISIALYSPLGFEEHTLKALAPNIEILQCKNDFEKYTKLFNKKLELYNAKRIYDYLLDISKHKDIVLLCYEKPPAFCHRHLVADWFNNELGIEVKELNYNK